MAEFRIGEVAERAGVSVDTVRYYERRKLLPMAPRTAGGYRVFTSESVERLLFIKQAQELGFSLDEIKELFTTGGARECEQVRDLLQRKVADMDGRIKKMKAFQTILAGHLSACDDELNAKGRQANCSVLFEIGRL